MSQLMANNHLTFVPKSSNVTSNNGKHNGFQYGLQVMADYHHTSIPTSSNVTSNNGKHNGFQHGLQVMADYHHTSIHTSSNVTSNNGKHNGSQHGLQVMVDYHRTSSTPIREKRINYADPDPKSLSIMYSDKTRTIWGPSKDKEGRRIDYRDGCRLTEIDNRWYNNTEERFEKYIV